MFHPRFPKEKLSFSDTAARNGIDNRIPDALLANAERLSQLLGFIEDKLQAEHPDGALEVTSGYRSPMLNELVGGSGLSYHKLALAADLRAGCLKPEEFAPFVKSVLADWDQIILEFGSWVHVGLPQLKRPSRKQCLSALKRPTADGKKKTVYLPGFTLK